MIVSMTKRKTKTKTIKYAHWDKNTRTGSYPIQAGSEEEEAVSVDPSDSNVCVSLVIAEKISVLVDLSRFTGRLVPSSLRRVMVAVAVDLNDPVLNGGRPIKLCGMDWMSWVKRWL